MAKGKKPAVKAAPKKAVAVKVESGKTKEDKAMDLQAHAKFSKFKVKGNK
jgi:hypothetical protein